MGYHGLGKKKSQAVVFIDLKIVEFPLNARIYVKFTWFKNKFLKYSEDTCCTKNTSHIINIKSKGIN